MSEPGFVIQGVFYPTPTAFKLGDPVLIEELTGKLFPDFAEALGDEDRQNDPAVLIGLIGVAVWHQHPKWPRARVVEYVQQLDIEAFEFQGGTEDEPVPPATAEPGENSPSSAGTSNGSPDTPVDPSSLISAGAPGSDTGSPG